MALKLQRLEHEVDELAARAPADDVEDEETRQEAARVG
jgi:hypothetical protein